jgi:hypothetical protein
VSDTPVTNQTEQFTAVALCPKCGDANIFPWRAPRYQPKGNDPVSRSQRQIATYADALNVTLSTDGWSSFTFDPDDATVVRQCPCGAEWPQR